MDRQPSPLPASSSPRGFVLAEALGILGVLVLPLLSYTGASLVDGNGFVAAFVGGLVFGAVAGRGFDNDVYFVEQSGALTSMISWLIFGALAVPVIGESLTWGVPAAWPPSSSPCLPWRT